MVTMMKGRGSQGKTDAVISQLVVWYSAIALFFHVWNAWLDWTIRKFSAFTDVKYRNSKRELTFHFKGVKLKLNSHDDRSATTNHTEHNGKSWSTHTLTHTPQKPHWVCKTNIYTGSASHSFAPSHLLSLSLSLWMFLMAVCCWAAASRVFPLAELTLSHPLLRLSNALLLSEQTRPLLSTSSSLLLPVKSALSSSFICFFLTFLLHPCLPPCPLPPPPGCQGH